MLGRLLRNMVKLCFYDWSRQRRDVTTGETPAGTIRRFGPEILSLIVYATLSLGCLLIEEVYFGFPSFLRRPYVLLQGLNGGLLFAYASIAVVLTVSPPLIMRRAIVLERSQSGSLPRDHKKRTWLCFLSLLMPWCRFMVLALPVYLCMAAMQPFFNDTPWSTSGISIIPGRTLTFHIFACKPLFIDWVSKLVPSLAFSWPSVLAAVGHWACDIATFFFACGVSFRLAVKHKWHLVLTWSAIQAFLLFFCVADIALAKLAWSFGRFNEWSQAVYLAYFLGSLVILAVLVTVGYRSVSGVPAQPIVPTPEAPKKNDEGEEVPK